MPTARTKQTVKIMNEMPTPEVKKYRDLTVSEVADILSVKKNTLILCHTRPDCDTLGSAFALREILRESGSRAWCVCANEIPERLRFVMQGQESVLRESIPADFDAERIISVDVASPAQLGELEGEYADKVDIMIDHHATGTRYADGLVRPRAAAAGEIIFDIAEELRRRGALTRTSRVPYTCIYAAISSDTGCFRYSSVTEDTHRIAAELVKMGVDTAEVNHLLYDSKPLIQLRAEKLGFDRLSMYEDGKIAIITFPYALKEQYGIKDEFLETLIDVARTVEGVEVAAAIRQPSNENVFRCSLRSNEDADVSSVAAKFGGGGHVKAAGCTVKADSIGDAEALVLEAIKAEITQ